MGLGKRIVFSTIVLVLAGQFSALAAGDLFDQAMTDESMPMVEKVPEGFFVSAPFINTLTVMIVRVFNDQSEAVLNVRSNGGLVELLATDLPDGQYHYQVKVVYQLDEIMGEDADYADEGVSWNAGSFYIQNSKIFQPETQLNNRLDEELGFIDVATKTVLAVLSSALNAVIPTASAADISSAPNGNFTHESSVPIARIYHNNNAASSAGRELWWEWRYYDTDAGGSDTQGVELSDYNTNNTIIDIQAGTGNNNAVEYFGNGDISWANSSMFLDKSSQQLALGTLLTPSDFTIYNASPDIRFHDETDTSEAEFELNNGLMLFKGKSVSSNGIVNIMSYDTDAPLGSLDIGSTGDIQMGTGFYFDQNGADSTLHIGGNAASAYDLMITSAVQSEIFFLNPGSSGVALGLKSNKFSASVDSNGDGGLDKGGIFSFDLGAPISSFALDDDGLLGLGRGQPLVAVHIERDDGRARVLVYESNGVQKPRDLFEISNNGNPEFRMTNRGNGNSWQFSAGLRFVVKNNAGDWVSRISAAGNMEISGMLITAGGTCGGGCDLVFDSETNIDTIEEHASVMWANSYLPAVGPTVENAPFNLTEKTGGMLNELEKAHIYIERLHKRLTKLETEQAATKMAMEKQSIQMQTMMTAIMNIQQASPVLTQTTVN